MSTDKTLADVKPGGRVRLGDQALRVFSAGRWTYDGTGQSFSHEEMDAAAFVVYRDAALSAQPSPGGQGDDDVLADIARKVIELIGSARPHHRKAVENALYQVLPALRDSLAARQPVGVPVAWLTHHDEPMLFPTAAEAAAYCKEDEQPVPLFRSPAQAVDLGQLRELADRWATDRSYSGSPADDLRTWIDSQA